MLTVDITSFQSGTHHVTLEPSADEVNLDPGSFEDIRVEAELQCHTDRILVKLHATATAELTCDRTLKPYDQPLAGNYNVLFGPPSMVGQEGEVFDEVRPLTREDREIEITDIVRDTLLLSVPQRQIAPGAEEEDIDLTFGEPDEPDDEPAADDEPADPRFSELKKLRDDEGSDDSR